MHKPTFPLARVAAAGALAAAAAGAHAQAAGTWLISVGAAQSKPHVSSGTLTAPSATNTQIDVGKDTAGVVSITRMLTDHWAVEVPLSTGFRAKIYGAGGIAGVGQIASARSLPISVFAQYRFLEPTAQVRPYAMLGITYAYFDRERGSATLSALNPINPAGGTGLSIDSRWALTPGLGVTAFFQDRWFVDAQYARALLKTKSTLSTGQTIDAKLNPDVLKLSVGMRF